MTYPDAIKGLVEAHEMNTCDESDCGQEQCMRSRAALDAFEKRQPLREDAELLHAAYGPLFRTLGIGIVEGAALAADILDALDAALFGSPTNEGSRG